MPKRNAFILCMLLVGLSSSIARADEFRLPDPHTFRPQLDGIGFLVAEAPETLDAGTVVVSLNGHFVADPSIPAGPHDVGAMERLVQTELVGGYGVREFASVGISVPFRLDQGVTGRDVRGYGLGDLGVWGKAQVLTEVGGPFSLGFTGHLFFPTGSSRNLLGDGRWRGHLTGSAGRQIGVLQLLLHVGYRLRSGEIDYLGLIYRDEVLFGGGIAYAENSRRYMLEAYGSTPEIELFHGGLTPIEALAGFRQRLSPVWSIDLGAGRRLTQAHGGPAYRIMAVLRFSAPGEEAEPVEEPSTMLQAGMP